MGNENCGRHSQDVHACLTAADCPFERLEGGKENVVDFCGAKSSLRRGRFLRVEAPVECLCIVTQFIPPVYNEFITYA